MPTDTNALYFMHIHIYTYMCVCAFVYHIHIYAEITKCNEFYASIVVKQRHKHKLETCTKARKLKMQTN